MSAAFSFGLSYLAQKDRQSAHGFRDRHALPLRRADGQADTTLAQKCRNEQFHLHIGEMHTDAFMCAPAEGGPGKPVHAVLGPFG